MDKAVPFLMISLFVGSLTIYFIPRLKKKFFHKISYLNYSMARGIPIVIFRETTEFVFFILLPLIYLS